MIKFKVNKTNNKKYPYNVQVLKMYKDAWIYSGEGRFCRDLDEVNEYIQKRNE